MITLNLDTNDNIQEIMDEYSKDELLEIHLAPGIYYQKLRISHHKLKLIGSFASESIIDYDDYNYKMHEDGLLYNTFRTPTLTILSNDVELHQLSIRNSAGSGFTIGQAVALAIYGNHTKIVSCHLLGHQDTLFIGPLPIDLTIRYNEFLPLSEIQTLDTLSYFETCKIEGDVDFIFGSGCALFQKCEIIALNQGYICAPSTYETSQYGFVFVDCDIVSKSNSNDIYLARPWREYGSTIFYNCRFDGRFHKERYHDWDKHNFCFIEHPYITSPNSSELLWEDVKQLTVFIDQTINCFTK